MARFRIPSRRNASALPLSLLFLASSAAAASNRTCYFPDGSVSPGDFPCAETGTTHCCNSQNACLSTGYCMSAEQQPYVISRGSCTDNAWGTGCPAKCAGTNDDPSGGLPISWTGSSNNAGSPLYCCGPLVVENGSIACGNGEDMFVLGTSEIIFGVAILANTTQTNGTDSTGSGSSPSGTASSPASCSGASSGSSGSDSDSDSNDDVKKSAVNVTAVGAGVGVSLGVVAIGFATWALYERRKRHQQLQAFMNGTFPGMAMTHSQHLQGPGGPGGPGGQGGHVDASGINNMHPGNTGTPFSPAGTTTGTMHSSSPSNANVNVGQHGVYGANSTSTKYADSQQPLVELSAYPRQFEELPANRE